MRRRKTRARKRQRKLGFKQVANAAVGLVKRPIKKIYKYTIGEIP
jgi:hypothetical protein